jgi:hypothetical protein
MENKPRVFLARHEVSAEANTRKYTAQKIWLSD